MRKAWSIVLKCVACVALAACGGNGGSGGKSSDAPLLVALSATPNPAWIDAAVTFRATCVSASGNSTNLSYTWSFGDGESDTTTAGMDVHNYATAPTAPYSVTCTDNGVGSSTSATAAAPLKVSNYNLNVLATDVCSSGFQGFGWCWQNPLPTGSNLRAVAAVSSLTGWIVGDAGTVLETNDGGVHWSARYPQAGSDLLAIQAADQNTALVVARSGQILTTTDAGVTWSIASPSATQSLASVSIVSPTVTWAVDRNNAVLKTVDGGKSWSAVPTSGLPAGAMLNAVAATDTTTAWVAGGVPAAGLIANTKDGNSWAAHLFGASDLAPLVPPNDFVFVVDFSSVSLTGNTSRCATGPAKPSVWVGGYASSPTIDGITTYPVTLESLDAATFTGNGPGGGSPLVTAFDSQTAWSTQVSSAFSQDTVPLWLAAPIGVRSTTTGNSGWTDSPFAFANTVKINAFDSPNCRTGFAVGDGGTILATLDASSWNAQSGVSGGIGSANLVGVAAVSPNLAYALEETNATTPAFEAQAETTTSNYELFATYDGGLTWAAQTSPINSADIAGPLSAAGIPVPPGQIATNGFLTIAVGPGFIVSSVGVAGPGGVWDVFDTESASVFPWTATCFTGFPGETIDACSPSQLWTSVSLSSTAAWVTDPLGDIAVQDLTSYGVRWTLVSISPLIRSTVTATSYPAPSPVATTSQLVTGIAAIDPMKAIVVGSGGLISTTANQGATWTKVSLGTTADLNAIAVTTSGGSAGTGWAVGAYGVILKTTDYGQTWHSQSWSDTTVKFTAVSTPDGNTVWATGNTGSSSSILVYSSDSGASWTIQPTGAYSVASVYGLDPSTAWIVGANGAILKTLTAGQPPPPQ